MQYDEFVGQVQHQARLASGGEAVKAIHATLETLGERLFGGEAEHLVAQLPPEIGFYLCQARCRDTFDRAEFMERVALREGVSVSQARHHARAVLRVLCEAVSPGEIEDVRAQLPPDLKELLEPNAVPTA